MSDIQLQSSIPFLVIMLSQQVGQPKRQRMNYPQQVEKIPEPFLTQLLLDYGAHHAGGAKRE
jgi:hypothetical protein